MLRKWQVFKNLRVHLFRKSYRFISILDKIFLLLYSFMVSWWLMKGWLLVNVSNVEKEVYICSKLVYFVHIWMFFKIRVVMKNYEKFYFLFISKFRFDRVQVKMLNDTHLKGPIYKISCSRGINGNHNAVRDFGTGVFLWILWNFYRTPFFIEHFLWLLLFLDNVKSACSFKAYQFIENCFFSFKIWLFLKILATFVFAVSIKESTNSWDCHLFCVFLLQSILQDQQSIRGNYLFCKFHVNNPYAEPVGRKCSIYICCFKKILRTLENLNFICIEA